MRILPLFSVLFLCFSLSSQNQSTPADAEIRPVLLDKATISGLNLQRVQPRWAAPERILQSQSVFNGQDFSVNITSSNTAAHRWQNYSIDEFVYVLNGQAELTREYGSTTTFNKGEYFLVTKGFSGTWKTIGGPEHFRELAIYTKKRASQPKEGLMESPYLVDPSKISGIGQKKEASADLLLDGVELKIETYIARKGEEQTVTIFRDRFSHVLSGMVTVTTNSGRSQTFYTGDFFVLPRGFKGNLAYDGLEFYRELVVQSNLAANSND